MIHHHAEPIRKKLRKQADTYLSRGETLLKIQESWNNGGWRNPSGTQQPGKAHKPVGKALQRCASCCVFWSALASGFGMN